LCAFAAGNEQPEASEAAYGSHLAKKNSA